MQSAFAELAGQFKLGKLHRLVVGGAERQDSVGNGLAAISPQAEIVAIQDGARPCTSQALIAATIAVARETGAAVEVLLPLVRQHPQYHDATALLGAIYERTDRIDQARALYREAVANENLPQAVRFNFALRIRALEEP